MHTKVYYKLFYSVQNKSHKPLKVAAAKKLFPKCVYHRYNLLRLIFFSPCDNCKQYFLHKQIITQRLGATAMLLHSFKQVFWKKSIFYVRCLHNNNYGRRLSLDINISAKYLYARKHTHNKDEKATEIIFCECNEN